MERKFFFLSQQIGDIYWTNIVLSTLHAVSIENVIFTSTLGDSL